MIRSEHGLVEKGTWLGSGGLLYERRAMLNPQDEPNRHHPDLDGPALRTFAGLAAVWRLSEAEQAKLLGLADPSTLEQWNESPSPQLPDDTLQRISYLLGIFKAINTLLPDEDRADQWLRAPNSAPLFAGGSALERMMTGKISDLEQVRRYLDDQLL